jgi:2-polyprenyl-3-methyl-5-hydroxy-6-metoxy-1,4-benzoquinol methylase
MNMVLTKLDPACMIDTCTVCGGGEFKFLFAKHGWRIEQCRACGFVFVNPRYTEAQADTIYNQADWFFSGRDGDGKKNYADEELASAQRAEKAIGQIRKFKDGAGLKLLDVGCGLGYVLDAGKKAGFDVSGIDISAQGVAICRQKGHAAETGVLKTTALGSGQRYDIITAFDVFEHICDPLAFLDGSE